MRSDAPGLDRIRTLVADHKKVAPIARLLGARVLSVEAGCVLVEFAVEAALRDSAGTEYARSSSVGAIRRPVQK